MYIYKNIKMFILTLHYGFNREVSSFLKFLSTCRIADTGKLNKCMLESLPNPI